MRTLTNTRNNSKQEESRIGVSIDNKDGSVKVYEGVYSGSIYEMETWVRSNREDRRSDDEIVTEMQELGYVTCAGYERRIGYYQTRERAEQTLDEMHDSCWESDLNLDFAVIRQKVSHMQMRPNDFIKEWLYGWGVNHKPVDETLVRNFDLKHNPFTGRPKEMIHHKVGDIVVVYNNNERYAYWGIVCALPPTPEEVSKRSEYHFDYNDDCYTIITTNTGYNSHKHVPSHYVANTSWLFPPGKVVELLKEGLAKFEKMGKVRVTKRFINSKPLEEKVVEDVICFRSIRPLFQGLLDDCHTPEAVSIINTLKEMPTDQLEEKLNTLSIREREVTRMLIGLDYRSMSVDEVADYFELLPSRIRQIRDMALKKINSAEN